MYQTPQLTRFGTFREVTQAGISGPLDGYQIRNDGCGAPDIGQAGRCS